MYEAWYQHHGTSHCRAAPRVNHAPADQPAPTAQRSASNVRSRVPRRAQTCAHVGLMEKMS